MVTREITGQVGHVEILMIENHLSFNLFRMRMGRAQIDETLQIDNQRLGPALNGDFLKNLIM